MDTQNSFVVPSISACSGQGRPCHWPRFTRPCNFTRPGRPGSEAYSRSDTSRSPGCGGTGVVVVEASVLQRGQVDPRAWIDASLRWLVDPARRPDDEPTRGPHIGMPDVERFKTTVDFFVQLDNRFGGGHARQSLIQYLSTDGDRLLRGRYTDKVAHLLFSAVAEATLLAAWMAYDSAPISGLAQALPGSQVWGCLWFLRRAGPKRAACGPVACLAGR